MPPTRRRFCGPRIRPLDRNYAPRQQNKVVILGHSKVKRLSRHTAATGPGQHFPNLNLKKTEFDIRLIGIGGANRQRMTQEIPLVLALSPDILLLEIGSNDLCDHNLDPSILARSLTEMADKLCQSGVKRVMIGQILHRKIPGAYWFPAPHQFGNPRYAWALDIEAYNERVNKANSALKDAIKKRANAAIAFWEHFGFWNPTQDPLHNDGVHLNPHGMKLYANSLKWAILRARESL